MKSLAIKYRPSSFGDVIEQSSIKTILTQQLDSGETKNAYLFCGGAGTGKTTCARIFANEINKHQGNPIEMDAASNSSVEDVRKIIQQAKMKSLDSEFKVFIIDECHSISNTGWQAFLKLIEEPPAKSVFIFCTTDPQKIPKTILSRVQRYDFQRISHKGVVDRLNYIIHKEWEENPEWDAELDTAAVDYIAKIADGGMRDAITLLDKCLAYDKDLTLENVVAALNVADYDFMEKLLTSIISKNAQDIIAGIESVHMSGKDLKQVMKQFTNFVLDVIKYSLTGDAKYISIPEYYESSLKEWTKYDLTPLLSTLVKLNSSIKWDDSPKATIEATLIMEISQ